MQISGGRQLQDKGKCKGPEAGADLVCSRNGKETGGAEA